MKYFNQVKNNPTYSIVITFLKSEIHHYFVNLFKVSGRSIEEISIGLLAYFFDSFFF